MIRSTKHILNYQNQGKADILERIFVDYRICLEEYIRLILNGQLPLKKFLSSKDLPVISNIQNNSWKSQCYQQASGIMRANLKYIKNKTFKKYQKVYHYFAKKDVLQSIISKRYSELNINYLKRMKIDIKDISLNISRDNFNIQQGNLFNHFVRITTPYKKSQFRYLTINIPVKEHKHSLKYSNIWKRKDFIQLTKNIDGKMFINFVYEKDDKPVKTSGNTIAFDCGYKKLLSDDKGNHYGTDLNEIYIKLADKQRGSKNYNQLLQHKKNEINRAVNLLPLSDKNLVIIEDLVQVKHKTKISTSVMNKMQYWSYKQVIDKLECLSKEEGFYLTKVNPAYTSQTCSGCGNIDAKARQGEQYHCSICNLEMDADTNAAINILHRGIYSSSDHQSL